MRGSLWSGIWMSLALFALAPISALAADDPIGVWLGHDKDGHVEIVPCGTFLCGHIISILDPTVPPNPRDIYNEDPAKHSRPICGLQVLGNLKKESSSWDDGWVYDPRRGKTYDAEIWLKDVNTLAVRGYIGVKFMSETKIWTRAGKDVRRCTRQRP